MENKVQEYLSKIREADGLSHAILCGITILKRENGAEFSLVTDKVYSARDEAHAKAVSEAYLPSGMTARVRIVKRVPEAETLKKRIIEFIRKGYPAAAAFLEEKHIEVEMLESGAHFYVDIASGEQALFSSGEILDAVSKYLSSGYCGSFYGNVRIVEKEAADPSILAEIEERDEDEVVPLEIRRFPIVDYGKIDGADEPLTTAVYMADSMNAEGTFVVCGAITHIEEIEYTKQNEATGEKVRKTRFSLTVNDGSAGLRTTYFPKKATHEKVRALQEGDKIAITGSNEEFYGSTYFRAAKINYGAPPADFVPVPKKGKPVPKAYHYVFPKPYSDYTQTALFEDLSKPEVLRKNVFVVFDLETTGLSNNPATGRMDKIIEIGAVKLVNGEMTERFSSFVACKTKLSKEIVALTGIQDADLVGAPEVDKVMADFYKFADGAYLVGHNVGFDYRFIHYYGEQNGYMFEHKQFDTCALAQEVLRGQLLNYKLNTVADHYGFTFNHHRAFDDACVTAKVFVELVKAKGGL